MIRLAAFLSLSSSLHDLSSSPGVCARRRMFRTLFDGNDRDGPDDVELGQEGEVGTSGSGTQIPNSGRGQDSPRPVCRGPKSRYGEPIHDVGPQRRCTPSKAGLVCFIGSVAAITGSLALNTHIAIDNAKNNAKMPKTLPYTSKTIDINGAITKTSDFSSTKTSGSTSLDFSDCEETDEGTVCHRPKNTETMDVDQTGSTSNGIGNGVSGVGVSSIDAYGNDLGTMYSDNIDDLGIHGETPAAYPIDLNDAGEVGQSRADGTGEVGQQEDLGGVGQSRADTPGVTGILQSTAPGMIQSTYSTSGRGTLDPQDNFRARGGGFLSK